MSKIEIFKIFEIVDFVVFFLRGKNCCVIIETFTNEKCSVEMRKLRMIAQDIDDA